MEATVSTPDPSVQGLSVRAARSIIKSLRDGVVPQAGADNFTAGRARWIESLDENLEDLADESADGGILRIFNGRNGDGKSHLMELLRERALARGFVVSRIVISRTVRLHRWDKIYAEIAANVTTPTRPKHPGIRAILDPRSPDPGVAVNRLELVNKGIGIRAVPGIDPSFATAVFRYTTESTANVDTEQDLLLLGGWLEGDTQRLRSLAVNSVVDQNNGARMLRSLAATLRYFGLPGLVLMIDEVESVLALSSTFRREAYQTLRLLVDRDNIPTHSLVVASTTPPMFTDTEKGISTYPALASRINLSPGGSFVNYRATVVDLTRTPLTSADYGEIGSRIRDIHARARDWSAGDRVDDAFIAAASAVAASGDLVLAYSPTRIFVKLMADTLDLAEQHDEFVPSLDDLERQFGSIDMALVAAEEERELQSQGATL